MLNKVVVVTGGATGIGQATCHLLANEGALIALVDINDQAGKETVRTIQARGGKAEFWHLDVTKETDVKNILDTIAEKFQHINVLVNNAGMIGANKSTHEMTEAEWDQVMNVNVKGTFLCTKHIVPHLKQSGGGSIINISSIHGILGTPDYPANHAAKGAIRSMSKTDATLYAADKIRVNSIHPGYIRTPCLGDVPAKLSDNYFGEALDIAYGILYLASDESKFVTASELIIDGGFSGGRVFN